jgi:hypothetical protein
LNQVQREHADLLVFPAVAGHLAAAGEEHEIRGFSLSESCRWRLA